MPVPQPRTSTPNLHQHFASKVREKAPQLQACTLDLGCGSSALLERLASMGYRDLKEEDNGKITSMQAGNYHPNLKYWQDFMKS
jgi:2-polyprenyl-3-methyl-5-hydroxy-6-metoxy-1,4-benzoquinol methylase